MRLSGQSVAQAADINRLVHVLIVDNEEEITDLVSFVLHREGFRVSTASDGLSACQLIGRERPDLILLDVLMPKLDGWEICRMIRALPDQAMATLPIIMLSALSSIEAQLKGLNLGANSYMTKPFVISALVAEVNRFTRKEPLPPDCSGASM
ncbi:MAG: response regulator [Desulfuromonadales bacterium]|nr:response regulator [Desulfuromonadales bacterium]MDT8424257.1 response regulator [Desulfuromonadales bacterium]